jgi:hypothetical protein
MSEWWDSFSLPGQLSNWIAAGALFVSLAVALGQLFGYLSRRRAEKLNIRIQEEVDDWWRGRAELEISWLSRTTLLLSNYGPEHAYNVRIEIQAPDSKPIPYPVEPESIQLFAAGTSMKRIEIRGYHQRWAVSSPGKTRDLTEHPPDTIIVRLRWTDQKGDHSARHVLTRSGF